MERRAKAAAIFPTIRGIASADRPQVGSLHRLATSCWTSCPGRSSRRWPSWAPRARTTSCAPRSSRWCVDLPATASRRGDPRAAAAAARGVPGRLPGLLRPQRHRRTRPPMRGADPAIVLVPGVGMFSFGKDKQTARVAGEFYVNAINVMRGAESVSTYAPIPEARSSGSSTGHWRRPSSRGCRSRSRWRPGSRWSPAPARGSARPSPQRLAAEGACVVVADLNLANAPAGRRRARRRRTRRSRSSVRRLRRGRRGRGAGRGRARLRRRGPGGQQRRVCRSPSRCWRRRSRDWDLQHDVMAKGSFLVSREAARVMIEQELGGDIVYISSKNSVFAGPNNIAYSARPRPTRPTRSGCWPPSSGRTASGSTASTPTGSCAAPGSSPAAGAPSAPRSTGSRRRTSAPTTPSAPCWAARCCPSTSPTPCSP